MPYTRLMWAQAAVRRAGAEAVAEVCMTAGRVRRLRSPGTFAEPAPEPEVKAPAPPEPGQYPRKMSIIAI